MTATAETTDARSRPLNERIRWAREQAGYTQERFAEAIGTSRRHVMRWERTQGKPAKPGVKYVQLIADATGQPAELFTDGDDEDVSG